MNWVGNWDLWGAVRWSDIGGVRARPRALWLNRLWLAGGRRLFIVLAVRFFARRERDAATLVHRLRPRALARGALFFSPWALAPARAARAPVARRRRTGAKAARREAHQGLLEARTWPPGRTRPLPSIVDVELDLDLEPEQSWFSGRGHVRARQRPRQAAGADRGDGGAALRGVRLDDRRRGGRARGPRRAARVHAGDAARRRRDRCASASATRAPSRRGSAKNGGGTDEFILPSGVVLTSFGAELRADGRLRRGDRHRRGQPVRRRRSTPTTSTRGSPTRASATTSRRRPAITIRIPEAYTANSVGTLVKDEVAGRRADLRVGERSPGRASSTSSRASGPCAGARARRSTTTRRTPTTSTR